MRPFVAVLAAAALAACAHDDGVIAGTATIHSGTPEGVRVTDAPLAEQPLAPGGVRAQLGDRLARAYCGHDRACGLGEAETLRLSEEACFSDARYSLRASIEQWPCRPSAAMTGFDECIKAIRAADCSARSGEGAQIRACQASEICRRSNIDSQ